MNEGGGGEGVGDGGDGDGGEGDGGGGEGDMNAVRTQHSASRQRLPGLAAAAALEALIR